MLVYAYATKQSLGIGKATKVNYTCALYTKLSCCNHYKPLYGLMQGTIHDDVFFLPLPHRVFTARAMLALQALY